MQATEMADDDDVIIIAASFWHIFDYSDKNGQCRR